MKRNVLYGVVVLFCLMIGASHATELGIFGPKQYVRTTGDPNIYEDTFAAVQGSGTLVIRNGEPDSSHRVTAAYIYVNDVLIYEPDDFKQFEHILDLPLDLAAINSLRVELRSKPDTYLTIEFLQAPPTVTLAADPVKIRLGDSATLTWTSTMSAACAIDPGIGSVDLNGVLSVSPRENMTYTVTATAPAGTATATAEVTVIPPPIVGFTVEPVVIIEDESTVLTWSTQYADTVSIDPGIGPVDINGAMTVSPTATTTYTLTAVGWAGTTQSQLTVTVIPKPRAELSVAPQTIIEGETAVLTWTSMHADMVIIEPGIGQVNANGSMSVSPTETTTYTLTATGPGGTIQSQTMLTVIPKPKATLAVAPQTINWGETATLTWTSSHADTVIIEPGIGQVNANGSMPVSPTETTTYTLTATGPGGTVQAQTTLTVIAKPEVEISVSPSVIMAGQSAILKWTSIRAQSCQISPAPGDVALNGSAVVSPSSTTTYTITATAPSGNTAVATVEVTVLNPPVVELTATPNRILNGGFVTLTWTSLHADSCEISPAIGTVAANGTVRAFPSAATIYTITAHGPGGTATALVQVDVMPQTILSSQTGFEQGVFENTEYYNNAIRLASGVNMLPYIWVANSSQQTVSKINTLTGQELGRYRTGPNSPNPSRTTVDSEGNLWVGNRDTASATKIALYPRDKNGDGIIKTSTGASNILSWGQDEAIEFFVSAPKGVRGVAVDAYDNVWLGGYSENNIYYCDGKTGARLKTINIGRKSYGALVDKKGTLWISSRGSNGLTRVDNPNAGTVYNPGGNHTVSFIAAGGDVYGIGIDKDGYIYSSGYSGGVIRKYDPVGKRWIYKNSAGGNGRGIATDSKGNGWMADSLNSCVVRFDLPTGKVITKIPVRRGPTGVAVDSESKIWVTNTTDNSVQRINPDTNMVEFTQTGHPNPYNYSDMTGYISRNITSSNGNWSIVFDSMQENTPWGVITWSSYEPPGTLLRVKARTSPDQSAWSSWRDAASGVIVPGLPIGRYIEVEVALIIQQGDESPQLYDLGISSIWEGFANTRPRIVSQAVAAMDEGQPYQYPAIAQDSEDAELSFALQKAPQGMVIDNLSGLITWDTDAYSAGEYPVSIKVTDPVGAFDIQNYTLTVNDALECNSGEVQVCGANVGECRMGERTCVNGAWEACVGSIEPVAEVCDGLDNDCDLETDEELVPPNADKQCGVCADAVKTCGGANGWQEPEYAAIAGYEAFETLSDGLDNDCDCETDVIKTLTPDLAGRTRQQAETLLADADLALGNVDSAYSLTVPEYKVISQNPAAGATLVVGSAVDIVISLGEPKVAVPDVVGMNLSEAEATLVGTGHLTLGAVTEAYLAAQPAGQVFMQNPAAGMLASYNTAVNLSVSLGPWTGADETPPMIDLQVSKERISLGGAVVIHAWAGDDVGVTAQSLTVNGELLSPPYGNVEYTPAAAGFFTVTMTASDAAGHTSTAEKTFSAFDPNDAAPPTVSLTTTDCVDVYEQYTVNGSVSDPSGVTYELLYREQGTTAWTGFAQNSGSTFDGALGVFDPTMLKNGVYEILLSAEDANGNVATASGCALVDGQMKLGQVNLPVSDISLPENGFDLSLERTYDSRDETGDFGPGWKLPSSDVKVQPTKSLGGGWGEEARSGGLGLTTYYLIEKHRHVLVIRLPGDETLKFKMDVNPKSSVLIPIENHSNLNAAFVPLTGTQATLTPLNGDAGNLMLIGNELREYGVDSYNPTRFRVTMKDGTRYVVSMAKGLESMTDLNGHTITYGANSITHSSGASIAFERGAGNRIETITDSQGHKIEYHYDAEGMLEKVIQSGTEHPAIRTLANYGYFAKHVFPRPVLKDILAPDGQKLGTFEYDSKGRVTALIDAEGHRIIYGYDLPSHVQTITDRLGNATVYIYDGKGNVTQKTDPLGNVTQWTYDGRGNKLSETDALGRTTNSTYDSADNLLSETDPLGHVTSYTYNSRGEVLTTTDPLGNVTTNTYDATGNLLTTTDALGNATTHTYDTTGNLLTSTDALGHVTAYVYDTKGNRISETDALGSVTAYTYDGYGNELTVTRQRTLGNGQTVNMVTTNVYDCRNRLVSTTDPDGHVSRIEYNVLGKKSADIDPNGARTEYSYDANGNLTVTSFADGTTRTDVYDAEGSRTSTTDRSGNTTSMEYDALKRLTRTIHPDGADTVMEYDDAGNMTANVDENGNRTEFGYDAAGRRVSVIDALGHTTSFAYDAAGNQISVTDANNHVTAYEYDDLGRAVKTTFADGTFSTVAYDALGRKVAETDPAGKVTQFGYDEMGRLIAVTDALAGATDYVYDDVGNKTSQTDPNGNTTTWEYDNDGRVILHTLPMGMSESFVYDPVGNLIQKTDFNGDATVYAYSVCCGRMLSKTYADGSSVSFTYTPNGKTATETDSRGVTSYQYDERDRLIQVTHPDGSVISYAYDARGNRTSVTVPSGTTTYTFDALNRLASCTDPDGGVTSYTYDNAGNRQAVTYPNGATAEYTYDDLNRLVYLENRKSSSEVISIYTYTLDAAGNRISVAENTGRMVNYTYDDLYRLTQETITDPGAGNQVIAYTYDAFGNRLTKTGSDGTVGYTYDANDRLVSESGPGSIKTYAYDLNGNTVQVSGDTVQTYAYDAENRLASVDDGSVFTAFAYDADGIRIGKVVDGAATAYLVDKNRDYAQVLEERNGSGSLTVSYVYGDDLISQDRGDRSFYLYDGQLSTRQLTGADGTVTDDYSYDSFGILLNKTGSTENDYLYAGEQYDPNAGFYYLRARYMSPETGRFLTTDPFEGFEDTPLSLHKYLYAGDNPVMFSDPSGNFALADVSCAMGIRNILQEMQLNTGLSILDAKEGDVDAVIVGLAFGGAVPVIGNVGKWATKAGKNLLKENKGLAWLWRHEGKGHTIEKHITKDYSFLIKRLATEPNIPAATSFISLHSAQKAIASAVNKDSRIIKDWLKSNSKNPLQLKYYGNETLGYGYVRGIPEKQFFNSAKIVLKKGGQRGEYFVLTSYPE